ncbi:unnamed protein product [Rhodiola kirilowii]
MHLHAPKINACQNGRTEETAMKHWLISTEPRTKAAQAIFIHRFPTIGSTTHGPQKRRQRGFES